MTWRNTLVSVLEPLDPKRGVELGVNAGGTSEVLLHRFPNLHLVMIDTWGTCEKYAAGSDPTARADAETWKKRKSLSIASTQFAAVRRTILELPSFGASRTIKDGTLDFAFIDANHEYEYVLIDSKLWHPKIRRGGLLVWHDYGNGSAHTRGVKPAVDEFVRERELELNVEDHCIAWARV